MMRILKRALLALGGLVLLLFVVLYGGSEWVIRSGHAVPLEKVAVPKDAASIAEGGRMARAFGCRDCHGADGAGSVMIDDPMLGKVTAPAFAQVAATLSDDEIARAVRHGVHKDGTTMWIMPVKAYNFIADDDMSRVIAWIRSLKPTDKDQPRGMRFGPVGRGLVLFGMLPPSVRPGSVADKTRPADFGRYIVDTSCTGCHALDHPQKAEDGKQIVPALAPMAAGFDLPSFTKLLRTGVGKTPRDLGLMRMVALSAYGPSLTDAEIAAIHKYLSEEAERQAR